MTFSREKSVLTKVVPYDARSLKKIGLKLSQNGGGEGVSTQSTIIIVLFFFSTLTPSLIYFFFFKIAPQNLHTFFYFDGFPTLLKSACNKWIRVFVMFYIFLLTKTITTIEDMMERMEDIRITGNRKSSSRFLASINSDTANNKYQI